MGRNRGMEFCCCAVPLVNAGAYLLVLEFAFVSLVTASLALGPPQIVATMGAIPTWSKSLIAALGFITFFWQPLGLFTIIKQKAGLYRLYIRVNFILTVLVIISTLAFFAISASNHEKVLTTCTAVYGITPSSNSGATVSQTSNVLSGSGRAICNIFIWVQVGVMGGLITLMGFTQLYMCVAQRAYGQRQREAQGSFEKYQYTAADGGIDSIPLSARDSTAWEPRDGPGHTGGDYAGYGQHYETRHNVGPAYATYGGGGSPTSPDKAGRYNDYPSYRPEPVAKNSAY
ncbi:hypothetical protein ACQY0O_000314 [Thecaphora frezii]